MSVASSYARALFEAARDGRASVADMEAMEKQMDEFLRVLDTSKEARVVLFGPATSSKEKSAIVTDLCTRVGASDVLRRFLVIMAQKGRFVMLAEIREAFSQVRVENDGGVMGKIVSADPMDAADIEGLARAFQQKLGKRVAFRASTDANLLAGMKVTVQGVTYDGTLQTQLQRLRDRLLVTTETVH